LATGAIGTLMKTMEEALKNYVKAAGINKVFYTRFLLKAGKTALALGKKHKYFTTCKESIRCVSGLHQLMLQLG
jgi:hypothetical protein